jgi:16S rRNA (cytosine967-C5)-methyltransferase
MIPAARISAAIEVIGDIETNRRPAVEALKAWGLAHRFAGSGDRAAIAGIAYDTLRRKSSAGFLMQSDTPRAVVLGMLKLERGFSAEAIAGLFSGQRFAPEPLTDGERQALASATLNNAPAHVAGDYPEWLDAYLARTFGDDRVEEAVALARRAPLDLRVNTLKGSREQALAQLSHLGVAACQWSPIGLRIAPKPDARSPAIQAEPAFLKGLVEVQDEGSQLVALMAGAKPGETVIDLCAGAGGKTLALAAAMENRGRLIATDHDKRRLAPIHDRLKRAGAHCVEVRTPAGNADLLTDISGRADLVLIDAPCTGTGTWRRNPDAKWRTRPGALDQRCKEQAEVLDRAVVLVKPGGRIAYVTCSVLTEENDEQAQAFVKRNPQFESALVMPNEWIADDLLQRLRQTALATGTGLLMTPRRTGTDGFYLAMFRRT